MARVFSGDQSKVESEFENHDRLMKEAFSREQMENTMVVNKDTTNTGHTQGKIVNLE